MINLLTESDNQSYSDDCSSSVLAKTPLKFENSRS